MLSLCLSTTPFSPSSPSSSDPSEDSCHRHPSSAPIPIGAHLEENGMARSAPSSLSSSVESIQSVRSSYSSRSAAERESERRERRRLLDLSISKIQGVNVPLRRHLLVYNAAKVLQKDLDALDEEDLYATLMEPLHSNMEVVDSWADFSEKALTKGECTDYIVEKMEVEETVVAPAANIWQWMANSNEQQQTEPLSQHQESWCLSSSVVEGVSSSQSSCPSSAPTWSLFSGMGAFAWSSPVDDTPLFGPDATSDAFFEPYACGDFSRVWGALAAPPLSSRDLLHLLPMEA
ncbi:hypothetical protein PFISCL1PPCAC_2965 [Pristionchus fissidentatus]|uniref:SERTA domain-containing protein n=1 Tax=Pristionchus fissidentatus TaxID=1538716 RepID=A0AAV5UZT2_9BILA|nr:hypothetical protein PFISCL1PPCAC_2965 [Pristionchus fissidentatus]